MPDATDFKALRSHIRCFIDDDAFDQVGFLRLVRILHGYPLPERTIAYEYLLQEVVRATGDDRQARAKALGRIADLVGHEPPEIAQAVRPVLRSATG